MNINLEIRLYNDLMMLEAFQNGNAFIKTAEDSSILSKMKSYFSNQINPNSKFESITNFLAPGIISTALGGGIFAMLINLVLSALGIDFGTMISSVWEKLSNKFHNKTITEQDIVNATDSVVAQQDTNLTPEQEQNTIQVLKDNPAILKEIAGVRTATINVSNQLKNKHIKLSTIKYDLQSLARSSKLKSNSLKIVGKIIQFAFMAIISAFGINLTSNIVKKVMDKPNAFDGPTYKQEPANNLPTNPSYQDNKYNASGSTWIEKYDNTTSGITDLLLDFAKDVYGNIDLNQVKNSKEFDNTVNLIEQHNIISVGDRMVFIPKQFKTKKQLVDTFITNKVLNDTKSQPIKNTPQKDSDNLGPKTVIV